MGMRISYGWVPPEGYPEGSRRVWTPQSEPMKFGVTVNSKPEGFTVHVNSVFQKYIFCELMCFGRVIQVNCSCLIISQSELILM